VLFLLLCAARASYVCNKDCCPARVTKFEILDDKCLLTQHTFSFITKVISGSEGNLVLSPFSISNVLQLILLGSQGDTAFALSHALGSAALNIHPAAKCLQTELNLGTGRNLNMTNDFFVSSEYKGLYDEYKHKATTYYKASFYHAKFNTRLEGARKRINKIVATKTHGMIPNLYEPGVLSPETNLIIVNTVAFSAKWELQFHPDETVDSVFVGSDGQTYDVKMMQLEGELSNGYFDNLVLVDLKYENSEYGMLVAKPESSQSLSSVEQQISDLSILTTLSKLDKSSVSLRLPKFKMDYQADLSDLFTADSGLQSIFSTRANFSGLADGINLNSIIHKASIEVTEQGTVASAGTAADFSWRSTQNLISFDTPFVFFVYHKCDGLVAFQGRFAVPP